MVSVSTIWETALPAGTKLLAGDSGLTRQVTWVATIRPRPPAFAGFKGGELALLSSKALRLVDEGLTVDQVLSQLAQVQVAAVAVLGEIQPIATETARSLSIPLFSLPDEANLQEIERNVSRVLVEAQNDLYRRNLEINRQLTDIMVTTRGTDAVLNKLSQITKRTIVLEDRNFALRMISWPKGPLASEDAVSECMAQSNSDVQKWVRSVPLSVSDPPTAEFVVNSPFMSRLIAPVLGNAGVVGFLSLLSEDEEFSEMDRLAAARGSTACAIELAKERAVAEAQDKVQAHFLDEIIAGNLPNETVVVERAKRLGYDLTLPYFVIAVKVHSTNGRKGFSHTEDPEIESTVKDISLIIETELAKDGIKAPMRIKDDSIAVFCPILASADEKASKRTADRLEQLTRSSFKKAPISIGIGHPHAGVERLKLSFQEAEQALAMGLRLFGSGKTTHFSELGLYRLLFSMHGSSELESFYEEKLGKLVVYDARNNTELVKTLNAYFMSGNSPTEAAERLHLHRNTLLYRLQRIEEIAGIDLHNPEICLSLHLALRIGETLESLRS